MIYDLRTPTHNGRQRSATGRLHTVLAEAWSALNAGWPHVIITDGKRVVWTVRKHP